MLTQGVELVNYFFPHKILLGFFVVRNITICKLQTGST
jgi:hypothetical protein